MNIIIIRVDKNCFFSLIPCRFRKLLYLCSDRNNHTDMEEKKLTYKDVPFGYPLCFNDECAKKACCMHYQARLLLPEDHRQVRQHRRHPFRPLRRVLGLWVAVTHLSLWHTLSSFYIKFDQFCLIR